MLDVKQYAIEILKRFPPDAQKYDIFYRVLAIGMSDDLSRHVLYPHQWQIVFHTLAKYHPEYIEKYKDRIGGHAKANIRFPLCVYNPEYIEKYKDIFDTRVDWKIIKILLKHHNPDWHEYYNSKGYFDF